MISLTTLMKNNNSSNTCTSHMNKTFYSLKYNKSQPLPTSQILRKNLHVTSHSVINNLKIQSLIL